MSTIRVGRALLMGGVALSIAAAQSAKPLKFEVASIKALKMEPGLRPSFPGFLPGGKFTATAVPLKFIIATAWNVSFQSVRLSGGPDWINSFETVYDIEAKAPEGVITPGMPSNLRDQRMRSMLQALLEDRFKLRIRTESRDLPIYEVTVAKGGLKLEKSDTEEKDCEQAADSGTPCHSIQGGRGRGLHGKAVNIVDILGFVENWSGRPMVDKTGVQGLFKVETTGWQDAPPGQEPAPGAKAEDGSSAADVPTVFTLFERMGLKLTAQKGVVEVFVIDHVERPTEN